MAVGREPRAGGAHRQSGHAGWKGRGIPQQAAGNCLMPPPRRLSQNLSQTSPVPLPSPSPGREEEIVPGLDLLLPPPSLSPGTLLSFPSTDYTSCLLSSCTKIQISPFFDRRGVFRVPFPVLLRARPRARHRHTAPTCCAPWHTHVQVPYTARLSVSPHARAPGVTTHATVAHRPSLARREVWCDRSSATQRDGLVHVPLTTPPSALAMAASSCGE
jgi:hypothetical protein